MTSPAGPPIMVVDDDFDVRSSLQEILEDSGHRVVTAGHGREALELLRAGCRPGLILLDLMMPVMDGFELCALLTKDETFAHIPIIVVSAASGTREKALACGARGHLGKPLKLDDLLAAVDRTLGGGASSAGTAGG